MRHFARALAEKNIRVNSVHPGGVATPMIYNDAMASWSAEHPSFSPSQQPLLAVPPVEPEAISDTMVYLCGSTGRYVTGVAAEVDDRVGDLSRIHRRHGQFRLLRLAELGMVADQ